MKVSLVLAALLALLCIAVVGKPINRQFAGAVAAGAGLALIGAAKLAVLSAATGTAGTVGLLTLGKRSVGDEKAAFVGAKKLFGVAMKLEEGSDCLPRVFCDLATQKSVQNPSSFYKTLEVLGQEIEKKGEKSYSENNPGDVLLYATYLGRKSQNQLVCQLTFPECSEEAIHETANALEYFFDELQ